MRTVLIVLSALIFSGWSFAYAAPPVLLFSDIISGPKSGLGDGVGSGAIVTVWGTGLGSSQGSSTLSCGGQSPAHVYYWGNADGSSGPADLYTYHKMQEISFSVSGSASNGEGTISVTVGGVSSNTLPFTVRSGNIYHMTSSGSDSTGNGSYGNPWKTITGKDGSFSAGDTVYIHNGANQIDTYSSNPRFAGIRVDGSTAGNSSNPIAFVVWPNSTSIVRGATYGIINQGAKYVTFSKFTIQAGRNDDGSTTGRSTGIETISHGRFIGNSITDREDIIGSGGCADGGEAAIQGSNLDQSTSTDKIADCKIYGNYIWEWGCSGTHKFEHTTYMSNRSGRTSGTGSNFDVTAPEYGWNLLYNNHARGGLVYYDESNGDSDPCGDLTGTFKYHDNVIVNQQGYSLQAATDIGSSANLDCLSVDIEIYNNLFINAGIGGDGPDYDNDHVAISLGGRGMSSNVKIYNNTIYGTGGGGSSSGHHADLYVPDSSHWSGTIEWVNNIVHDGGDGTAFVSVGSGSSSTITAHSNNIWYSTSGSLSPPSWDTSPRTSNPQFVNIGGNDFTLQAGSPARDSGSSAVSSVVNRDLTGIPRPQGSTYDIGAYEYDDNSTPLPPISYTKPIITNLQIRDR